MSGVLSSTAEPASAARAAFLKDRSASMYEDRFESCNASCRVRLYSANGEVAALGGGGGGGGGGAVEDAARGGAIRQETCCVRGSSCPYADVC
jgi:hypothetical protein